MTKVEKAERDREKAERERVAQMASKAGTSGAYNVVSSPAQPVSTSLAVDA